MTSSQCEASTAAVAAQVGVRAVTDADLDADRRVSCAAPTSTASESDDLMLEVGRVQFDRWHGDALRELSTM